MVDKKVKFLELFSHIMFEEMSSKEIKDIMIKLLIQEETELR